MRSLAALFVALLVVGSLAYEATVENAHVDEVVLDEKPQAPVNAPTLTSELCVLFEDYPKDTNYNLHVVYEFHGAINSLELFYPNRKNQINEFSESFNVYTPGAVYQVHNGDGEDMNEWDSYFFQNDGVFYVQARSQAPLANLRFISPDYPLTIASKGPECMEKFMSLFHPLVDKPMEPIDQEIIKPLYPKVSICTLLILFFVVFIAMSMLMCVCATASKFGLIKLGRLPSYSKSRMQEEAEDDEDESLYNEDAEEMTEASAPQLDLQPPKPQTVEVAPQMPVVPMPVAVPSQGQQPAYPMPLYYVNHGGQWFAAIGTPQTTNNTAAPTN